jgi:tetratricopeptide (TPR) repeat protein
MRLVLGVVAMSLIGLVASGLVQRWRLAKAAEIQKLSFKISQKVADPLSRYRNDPVEERYRAALQEVAAESHVQAEGLRAQLKSGPQAAPSDGAAALEAVPALVAAGEFRMAADAASLAEVELTRQIGSDGGVVDADTRLRRENQWQSLGFAWQGVGQNRKAVRALDRRLDFISQETAAARWVAAVYDLGWAWAEAGEQSMAMAWYDKGQTFCLNTPELGRLSSSHLVLLNGMGVAASRAGDDARAIAAHREALKVREEMNVANEPSAFTTMLNLAVALDRQGSGLRVAGKAAEADAADKEAADLYTKAYEKRRTHSTLGPDNAEVAEVAMSWAAFLLKDLNEAESPQAKTRLSQAETLYRDALRIRESQQSAEHRDLKTLRSNLATCLARQGKLSEAILQMEALVESAKSDGQDRESSMDRAQMLYNLGCMYEMVDRFDEAETNMRQALELMKKNSASAAFIAIVEKQIFSVKAKKITRPKTK